VQQIQVMTVEAAVALAPLVQQVQDQRRVLVVMD
jgi:hypothetical protein